MIRIAFYKHNKKFIDRLIAGYTWIWNMGTPPYSHVEIGFKIDGEWQYFSSTMRNRSGSGGMRSNGTRWIIGKDLFTHPERWDVYELSEHRDIEDMYNLTRTLAGKLYDFIGILGFAMPMGLINNFKKWYCSELVFYIMTGTWKRRISPRRLFRLYRGCLFLIKTTT
jgi:hypothetical protein